MDLNSQKKVIVVLGMHRSGTSAITAGLSALGVDLGQVITEGCEENEKGYYENKKVQELNDRLLHSMGTAWNNPFFWHSVNFNQPEIVRCHGEAEELLRSCYGYSILWGVKDPRMCLLLPFWQKAIAQGRQSDTYYIHVVRNPVEVAESLIQRHLRKKHILCGDQLQNIFLWFLYHYKALEYVDHDRNILVTFDSLMRHPQQQLKRISDFIGLGPNQKSTDDYIHNFLDKRLKHHNKELVEPTEHFNDYEFIVNFYSRLIQLGGRSSFTRVDIKQLFESLPDLTLLKSYSKIAAQFFLKSNELHAVEEELVNYEKMHSEFEKCKVSMQNQVQEIQSQKELILKLQQKDEEPKFVTPEIKEGLKSVAQDVQVNHTVRRHHSFFRAFFSKMFRLWFL